MLLATLGAGAPALPSATHEPGSGERPSRLELTFRLDPRLTRGLYMGDRWVSPPTYTANLPASAAAVDVRAHVVDTAGRRTMAAARWTASDPATASVSRDTGSEARIVVHRAGESRVLVVAGGFSRELAVTAQSNGTALRVEIVQLALPEPHADPGRAPAAAAAEPADPAAHRERAGYAVGAYLGRRLRLEGWDVDPGALARGLEDALGAGAPRMSDAEIGSLVSELRRASRTRASRTQP